MHGCVSIQYEYMSTVSSSYGYPVIAWISKFVYRPYDISKYRSIYG